MKLNEEQINEAFQDFMKYPGHTTCTFIICSKILFKIDDWKDKREFYKSICESILEEDTKHMTFEEKDHFMRIHTDLTNIYSVMDEQIDLSPGQERALHKELVQMQEEDQD